MYALNPTKYWTYLSTTILKHANIFAKVNKSPYGRLHNMTTHDANSITIHICTLTIDENSNKKGNKTPFKNKQDIQAPNTII